jgi:hypothetical protein
MILNYENTILLTHEVYPHAVGFVVLTAVVMKSYIPEYRTLILALLLTKSKY